MAHFAELDEDNTVIRVIVVSNGQIIDHNTQLESEEVGIAFCKMIFGKDTRWVQTSYNRNFRRHFAGEGFKYSPEKDVFYPPCPNNNMYVLDEETCDWIIEDPELRQILGLL